MDPFCPVLVVTVRAPLNVTSAFAIPAPVGSKTTIVRLATQGVDEPWPQARGECQSKRLNSNALPASKRRARLEKGIGDPGSHSNRKARGTVDVIRRLHNFAPSLRPRAQLIRALALFRKAVDPPRLSGLLCI